MAACTTLAGSAGSGDAGTARPADASAEAVAPSIEDSTGKQDSAAPPDPILGAWERRTEPYKGMRVSITGGAALRAIVTAPPPVTDERLASQARSVPAAVAKKQLACQQSLWKPGDELVTGFRPASDGGYDATILVRDWGFTGTCRHADSRAPARLVVSATGELTIAVTRGKTVTQRWVRVDP